MAIKSTLLHYESYSSIANLRFSANAANTKYTIGPDGAEVYDVTPSTPVDIPYDKLVFIKDVSMDWTHGKARKFFSIDAFNVKISQALQEAKDYTDQHGADSILDFMEQEELEALTAEDCEEGVLYIGLGEIIQSNWTFGEKFPIKFGQ